MHGVHCANAKFKMHNAKLNLVGRGLAPADTDDMS